MKLIIIQYFGAGDVIFEQTLVRKLAKNYPVMWPVEPHMVSGFNRAYPHIMFVDRTTLNIDYNSKEDYIKDGVRYLPLRWADQILKVPYSQCMSAKYQLFDMNFNIWKQDAMWVRDRKKEQELFDYLGLKEGMEYTLVNRFFGTQSQLVAPIKEQGIEMCTIPGFSLFDWALVLERASQIFTVSTSVIFLLELLDLKAPVVNLFPRTPIETDFRNVEYILQKQKYIKHL